MAHIALGAALNKLVVLLQDGSGAPVAAKNSTRPEYDNKTDESNNVGDHANRERVWPQDRVMVNHKEGNRHCNQQNLNTPPSSLFLDCALDSKRGNYPVDDKDRPAEKDELSG
jgi:hypothetical protein